MSDLRFWLGFNSVSGIGPARLRALLDFFGDIERAWHGSLNDLREAGLDRRSLTNLVDARQRLDLDQLLSRLEQSGAHALTWDDDAYPASLRTVYDPPPLLFVKGTITVDDAWSVAVVGTRNPTAYGREVARQLATDLVRNRITVVSGLARGVDAQAHRAALDGGGRTLAVLGCGVDVIYPYEHRRLAQEICEAGALISDYPLGTLPEANNFPPRNRIISGLSLGVVVVEAGTVSGALITAQFATEQGREVFAVPGSILQRNSEGTNRLIRDGARPVLGVEDILQELNLKQVAQQAEARTLFPADETEALLVKHLSSEPRHINDVAHATGLPMATVASTLTLMELKGLVRQVGGMSYVLTRDTRLRDG
ncbi:MAG: DNA-processing protein DprA [Anaerolineae bacterium]|uniref:DNA-processing protein DprA n=1 Tax=Candidatus Amarolinea dominans TaxID=3140696 RepID=UPI001D3AEA1F|nr:DNA-protecting protein DprA [Anaerolineae bacterium]MBK7202591.1 DNA-protecting protein DprA [Anaerolineae bacterium]MBK9094511.1 DNA-protecting protein DprA [Anaerolineae bacterium]MBK9232958.1 DNA-protecting protein DprA [Anaerolineae bacterium]